MNLKERARDAFRKAVTRTEIQSYETAALGWRKSEKEVLLDVPGRPRHTYITKSDGTITIALNEANVPLSAFLPIKVRLENNSYVIKGQDVSATNALTNLPSSPYGIPSHPLSSHMDVAFANVQPGQVLGTEDGEIWTNMDAPGGVETFIELTDTPADYSGAANRFVTVSPASDGLVFDTVDWTDVTNPPAEFPPTDHSHEWADITDPPATFPPAAHSHAFVDLTDTPADYTGAANLFARVNGAGDALLFDNVDWADIASLPATFPPDDHTHVWTDITDPPATFPPAPHTHPVIDIIDIEITTPALNQVLAYDGTHWVNQDPAALSDTGIFLLLAGRAGGQVGHGGTGSSESLILHGTAHATKGPIILNPDGGNVVIGATAAGQAPLSVYKTTTTVTSEVDYAVRLQQAGGGATSLLFGLTATQSLIQSMQGGASWSTRPLILQANGGFVGIGELSPTSPLHIKSMAAGVAARLMQLYAPAASWVQFNIGRAGSSGNEGQFEWDAVNGIFKMQTNSHASPIQLGNQWGYFATNGRVGLGTNNPQAKIDLNTAGIATAIRIETSGVTTLLDFHNGANTQGKIYYNTALFLSTIGVPGTMGVGLESSSDILLTAQNGYTYFLTDRIGFFGYPSSSNGEGIIFIQNRVVAPTANPVNGGVLYAEGGALKWRGSSGTITTIANA